MTTLSSASAQNSCFRVNGVRAAGESGVTIERPGEFRGGGYNRSSLVLEHRRTLGGNLGGGLRRIKIPVTSQNKVKLAYSSHGLAFTYEQIAEALGLHAGSPAICAHWELATPGVGVRRSDEVCFRLGGIVRDMAGSRSGSVGVCQDSTGNVNGSGDNGGEIGDFE